MDRLVLWDIDRTLLTVAGVSIAFFAQALEVTTGQRFKQMPDMGGKTDQELVTTLLELHGVTATSVLVERFYAELGAAALAGTAQYRAKGYALPGASTALTALGAIPGIVQTVVTGNIPAIARLKLTLFDLAGLIDFEIGGYGSESADRAEIVGLARSRAATKYGNALPGKRVVVIGDTPHDIKGALGSGVMAIGVATGSSSAEELQQAGAHVVLPSLVDTAAVVTAVLQSVTDVE